MRLKYLWPPLYQNLFPRELLNFEVSETRATCDSCAKAPPKYKKPDYYESHLKCCTFQPYIPNYALGAILSEPSARYDKAKESLRKKIARREYCLPVGMVAPARYQIEFLENKKSIFGRDEDYLCSFYDRQKNQCGIWHYRGAVCTSFYCFSSYGSEGIKFWREMSDFQTYIEMALMEDAMVHLGYSPRQLSENLKHISRNPEEDPATASELKSWVMGKGIYQKLWSDHFEDIEGFYKKCYNHVLSFDRKMALEALGELGHELEKKLLVSLKRLEKRHLKTENKL